MSKQVINIGTVANDGTGDDIRVCFDKANQNLTELYDGAGGLLTRSAVAASALTGTTTETPLATINIPAGLLGANGILGVRSFWSMNNNANAKGMRVRLGGSGINGALAMQASGSTIVAGAFDTRIVNRNSQASQYFSVTGPRGSDNLMTQYFGTPATVDMTVAQNLYINGLLSNSGDSLVLEGYEVFYRK